MKEGVGFRGAHEWVGGVGFHTVRMSSSKTHWSVRLCRDRLALRNGGGWGGTGGRRKIQPKKRLLFLWRDMGLERLLDPRTKADSGPPPKDCLECKIVGVTTLSLSGARLLASPPFRSYPHGAVDTRPPPARALTFRRLAMRAGLYVLYHRQSIPASQKLGRIGAGVFGAGLLTLGVIRGAM